MPFEASNPPETPASSWAAGSFADRNASGAIDSEDRAASSQADSPHGWAYGKEQAGSPRECEWQLESANPTHSEASRLESKLLQTHPRGAS